MNINERLLEINTRVFAMEARMTILEEIAAEDRAHRKEVNSQIIEGQKVLDERVRRLDLKMAWYAGALAVVGIIFKVLVK